MVNSLAQSDNMSFDSDGSSSMDDPAALASKLGFEDILGTEVTEGSDLDEEEEDQSDEESSEDEDEYETDSDEDSEDDENFKGLVVKEAPLLRLENVTSQTRSKIPDDKKKGGSGGWGWFGFGGKNASASAPAHSPEHPSAPVTAIEPESEPEPKSVSEPEPELIVEPQVAPAAEPVPAAPEPKDESIIRQEPPQAKAQNREQEEQNEDNDEDDDSQDEDGPQQRAPLPPFLQYKPSEDESTHSKSAHSKELGVNTATASYMMKKSTASGVPAVIDKHDSSSRISVSSFGDSLHSAQGHTTTIKENTRIESPYKLETKTVSLAPAAAPQQPISEPSIQVEPIKQEPKTSSWKKGPAPTIPFQTAELSVPDETEATPAEETPNHSIISQYRSTPAFVAPSSKSESKKNTNQPASPSKTVPSLPSSSQEASTTATPLSPSKSPSKKKKKKKTKKSALDSHFGKSRKVTRHGDEVSVGTTTVPKRSAEPALHLLLAASMDDLDADGKKKRPWESVLSKRKKNQISTSPTAATAVAGEAADYPPTIVENVLEELESLKSSEHMFSEHTRGHYVDDDNSTMLGSVHGNSVAEDDISVFTGVSRATNSENRDNTTASGSEDNNNNSLNSEEEDDLAELMNLARLEANMELTVADNVDFDGMWDSVECDAPTADEFSRKQRLRNREKEEQKKRRMTRKKEKEQTQRLRIFERRQKELERRRKGRSRLSSEFLQTVHELFRDESAASYEDEDDPMIPVEMRTKSSKLGRALLRMESDKSLFLAPEENATVSASRTKSTDEDSASNINSKEGGSENGEDDDEDTDDDEMEEIGLIADVASVKSSLSRRSKFSTSSRKTRLDPTVVFEEEMKKAKATKVMTVADLRQEMADRRGTSVLLIRKEYATYKQNQSHAATAPHAVKSMNFANMDPALQFGGVDPTERSEREVTLREDDATIGGLTTGSNERIRRWGSDDGISALDDLLTVRQSPRQTSHGFIGKAQDLANHVNANLPDMPNIDVGNIQANVQTNVANVQATISRTLPNVDVSNLPISKVANTIRSNVQGASTMNKISTISSMRGPGSPRRTSHASISPGSPSKYLNSDDVSLASFRVSPKNDSSIRSTRSSFRDTTTLLLPGVNAAGSARTFSRGEASARTIGSKSEGSSQLKSPMKMPSDDPLSLLSKLKKDEEENMPSLQLPSLNDVGHQSTDFSFAASFADMNHLGTIAESEDDEAGARLFGGSSGDYDDDSQIKTKKGGVRFAFKKMKFPSMKLPKRRNHAGGALLGDD